MKIVNLFMMISLCLFSFGQQVWADNSKILISVGDLQKDSYVWRKHICDMAHSLANKVSNVPVDVTCRNLNISGVLDPELEKLRPKFSYHLRILRNRVGQVDVDVTNWAREHQTDFKTLGWNFKASTQNTELQEQAMAKAFANFFLFTSHQTGFKAGLLVNGVSESNLVSYDQKRGVFIDKALNVPISTNTAYSLFENESERKRNYLRTGIELGVTLAAGMGVYYQDISSNSRDFDYGLKDGLIKKLTGQAVLFDDNSKIANYGHEGAGVLYYQAARYNGFTSLESFLVGFATSAAWEFLEYRELFSINDQIMTPLGGYAIGEASYQISCTLLAKGGLASKVAGYALSPGAMVNHLIDGVASGDPYKSQPECRKERWSEISMYMGVEANQKPYKPSTNMTYNVGVNATVVNIEGFNKPGQSSQFIFDTAMVKAILEQNGGAGMGDIRLLAQVMWSAFNKKDLVADEENQLRGYDFTIGLGSGSAWNDRGDKKSKVGADHEDFYGSINVLGASAHTDLFYKGLHIQAEIAYYGDFAMVKAWALKDLKAKNNGDISSQSSVIQDHGYYWGLGTSTLASLSAEYGRWKVGYSAQFSNASEITGRNRHENSTTNPAHFNDEYLSQRVYVAYKITRNLSFQLSHEENIREGSADGVGSSKGVEHRTMGSIVYLF